jgi:Skp family chaperone for outer membrane proteins
MDATILMELNVWALHILQAYSEVAPTTETQLACERARRVEEHANVTKLHQRLHSIKNDFHQQYQELRSKTKEAMDDLTRATTFEQRKRQTAEKAIDSKRREAAQLLRQLQAQVDSRSDSSEIIATAMRGLHSISGAPDPKQVASSSRHIPFEGGYQFGDVTRSAMRWFSKKTSGDKPNNTSEVHGNPTELGENI